MRKFGLAAAIAASVAMTGCATYPNQYGYDPYYGGNHLPDVTVFAPVFEGETPRFWPITFKSHSTRPAPIPPAFSTSPVMIRESRSQSRSSVARSSTGVP